MNPSSGDYLFIGCKEKTSDAFNTGIFGAKEFLLEIREFENSPSMISKATGVPLRIKISNLDSIS